jgi:UDP-N-acetylmuramate--alanine ligase
MLLQMGYQVTGSDVRDSPNITALEALGAKITIGHDARNLGDADTVVVTSALWETNPELLLAIENGLPVLHRSALLAHLGSQGKLIAVAGAHGKTTSTGMVVTGLSKLGADPSFVNGGVIQEYGASSGFGKGEHFVIEADESDSSFLHYDTAVALITNVDPDHLDHFGSLEAFQGEFAKFADAASDLVVISSDDPGAIAVRQRLSHDRVITFGKDATATVRLSSIDSTGPQVSARIEYQGQSELLSLSIPGEHNAISAAGALAVVGGLGFDFSKSVEAVAGFRVTDRLLQLHGSHRGL